MNGNWQRTACSGGECPEVRVSGGRVEMRDSRRPHEMAWFTPAGWAAFITDAKAGKFDLPRDGL